MLVFGGGRHGSGIASGLLNIPYLLMIGLEARFGQLEGFERDCLSPFFFFEWRGTFSAGWVQGGG